MTPRRLAALVVVGVLGLAVRGWTVQPPQVTAAGPEFRSGELSARRSDDTVLYETGPALRGGGTHVAVHVSRG